MKIYVRCDVTHDSFEKLEYVFKEISEVPLDAHVTIAFADLNLPISSINMKKTLESRQKSAKGCSATLINLEWWPSWENDAGSQGYLVARVASDALIKRRFLWESVIYEPSSVVYRPHLTLCKNIKRVDAQTLIKKCKPSDLPVNINLHQECVEFIDKLGAAKRVY